MATIHGSEGDDTGPKSLKGTAGADEIFALGGHDQAFGRGGGDSVHGAGGDDQLFGDSGAQGVRGGDDLLDGGKGDDYLFGEGGADLLLGRAGDDLLDGGHGADGLWGEAGADRLLGGAGADGLVGGAGADDLWGGAGADRFSFMSTGDSVHFEDEVKDFQDGLDRIDLSNIDADKGKQGNQAFKLVGGNAFDGAGQVVQTSFLGDTIVSVNTDADLQPEMAFVVEGDLDFTAADFVL